MQDRNDEVPTVEQATYSIGEAAEASGVSIKAIRYYEEIRLIPKVDRRANGPHGSGHRVFSVSDVGRLKFIHHVRLLGLSLAEVRELIAIAEEHGCPGNRPEYRDVFARYLRTINERIDHLLQLRTTIEELMSADPSAGSRACTWETCGCMEPSEAPKTSSAAPDEACDDRSDTKPGGRHV